MKRLWNQVKQAIQHRIPEHSYRMWIEPLELRRNSDGSYTLSCPNFFTKKRIQTHYGSLIEFELNRILKKNCQFLIEVNGKNGATRLKTDTMLQMPLPKMDVRPHGGRLLRRDFTFDHFVVGKNNDFAYTASLSLASRKNNHQNALFLLSQTGMGKSHLSQAIGHHILSQHPLDRVYYVTAEDFSNEMIHAFRHDSIGKFKDKYRDKCDVLLLEDVHYISGKKRTQTELSLTLDALFELGKKVIFSSCCLPGDIPKIDDTLRSRLSCGVISIIEPPDYQTRIRILKRKAMAHGFELPEEVLCFLAAELTENVRQLESGLIGVTAQSSLMCQKIDLELAESVVKNIATRKHTITIAAIKKLVCKEYKISISDIVSRSRKRNIVHPRQIAMYLSRKYTDSPLQTIGRSFKRYHATALHAIGVIEKGLKKDPAMRKQIDYLSKKLESGNF